MDKISDVTFKPLEEGLYIKPVTMHFKHNGRERTWELLKVHDSVAIVIYNITRNVLVFVKQFRPAAYMACISDTDMQEPVDVDKYPANLGVTIEMCAGIVDKDKPVVEIAKEEVLEECGYEVPISSLQRVASYRSGVGHSGSLQTLYYCQVTDDMKVSSGGGIDDEIIDVIEMTVPEVQKYISEFPIASPPSFLFGIYWFLYSRIK